MSIAIKDLPYGLCDGCHQPRVTPETYCSEACKNKQELDRLSKAADDPKETE